MLSLTPKTKWVSSESYQQGKTVREWAGGAYKQESLLNTPPRPRCSLSTEVVRGPHYEQSNKEGWVWGWNILNRFEHMHMTA